MVCPKLKRVGVMQKSSEVLVLVANERNATLCSNKAGVTRLLRSIDCISPVTRTNDNLDPARSLSTTRHVYACELMMVLGRYVSERQCEGVIIYADTAMTDEIRSVRTALISQLLIAQIVGTPSEQCHFPGRSAANAELAYSGAQR
jgi:hypothetical protein